ncbi:NADH:flavin oxidoreductase [Picrophilus oshimae]|uniref:NADH oxidoreductase n=1 Tax=Picrophilus torridus (strain ATCC 700027 / DSM 9790 / JCM 10055 / NBRC 100828 / KAW 2/3) TaxID=1122961 RepID=Q6L244_PICTO|nr:NADH:flavin oxidoreductase [Picrophilus oshimae]AAT42958.1 NADH oxidoreductase [Picrophilus oshimae DSM 9789]
MDLFEPGNIGNLEIKNRMVMAPMISNICNPDGSINENYIYYMERRALGGFGLLITEYAYINDENSKGSPNELGIISKSYLPKMKRLTDVIHGHGSRIFTQLVHAGGKANPDYNKRMIFAPSSLNEYPFLRPDEMTVNDIESVEEDFLRAARLAYRANFDGIEIHGAHGYLIQEFISKDLNKRNDRYGGSLENNVRIANEIIDMIRAELDFPVGIRLSLYEDEGYGPDYGIKAARLIKNADYVHFSAGRSAPPGSSAPFYYERNHIYKRIRERIDKKTMVVGSVIDINDARTVLEGSDLVVFGRAALADPFLPEKFRRNLPLRPCIRCNQACRDLSRGEARCTVNVETGLESRIKYKKYHGEIAIGGAGIKGLEAALYASKLGLNVYIYDNYSFGGQINEIYDEYKKREFMNLLKYYESALKINNVKIEHEGSYDVLCKPDKVYPDIDGDVSIDSNVYKYHDLALKIALKNHVIMSYRSLNSLDRSRADFYTKMATRLGIEFKSDYDFEFVLIDRDQYDIRKAMESGRNAIERYIMERENEFL